MGVGRILFYNKFYGSSIGNRKRKYNWRFISQQLYGEPLYTVAVQIKKRLIIPNRSIRGYLTSVGSLLLYHKTNNSMWEIKIMRSLCCTNELIALLHRLSYFDDILMKNYIKDYFTIQHYKSYIPWMMLPYLTLHLDLRYLQNILGEIQIKQEPQNILALLNGGGMLL